MFKILLKVFTKNQENAIPNWYEEKYDSAIVQRNILFILLSILTSTILILIIVIYKISVSKKIQPFVIALEKETGITSIVQPTSDKLLTSQDSLSRYFIKKYVIARETYNPVDFESNKNIIRIFSTLPIYRNYLSFIKKNDPTIIFNNNTSYLTVRSWSNLAEKTYILRFSITDTGENPQTKYKIAIIKIDYIKMDLQNDELDINPIGFQVTGYRVDDDNS